MDAKEVKESLFEGDKYCLPEEILKWAPSRTFKKPKERNSDFVNPIANITLEPFILYSHENTQLEFLLLSLCVVTGVLRNVLPAVKGHDLVGALLNKTYGPQNKAKKTAKPHFVSLENASVERLFSASHSRLTFEKVSVRLRATASWKSLSEELPVNTTMNRVRDALEGIDWSVGRR
eukprot:Selendium_serpulae@DN6298_c0_g1_i4.p1